MGGPWLASLYNGTQLSSLHDTWNRRAEAYLRAYKVGWFYKAGSRISQDFANLAWTLNYEDSEGDNAEQITAAPGNVPWQQLDPLQQFLRLSERPNPYQSGRSFKQQQMIRLDFTGRALVYVEDDGTGLPSAWYGISPERMVPSRNKQGVLLGWVLDPDRPGGGVPFDAREIIAVEYPGIGEDPQGVVEAVYQHAQLSPMIPQHTADVLATGGRLAGMVWPKERSLTEDEFTDAQRAWRSVTSDPNAARRLLLFPEPMEYQQGSATPAEIGLPELATLSRDEILSTFPIHPYMVGVPLATGLNSGESLRYVRQEYWEGTQHPRVEVWEDAFQQALIPRYEQAIGRPLDLDIEEPDLDDAEALVAKSEAYKGLVAIGFDPKESVAAVGLDHIKWIGLPDLLDPAKQAEAQRQATEALANRPEPEPPNRPPTPKAIVPIKSRREQVVGETLPGFNASMRRFLDEQADRLAGEIERVLGPRTKAERKKALPDDWWDQKREDAYLREHLRGLYVRLARSALTVVSNDTDRVVTKTRIERVTNQMLEAAGTRITGINETTRKAVSESVSEGVRRGYSIGQIVAGVADEGYRGVKQLPSFDEARAELVARTETMLAYNESALRGYSEFGISQVEAIDGDGDPECEERNGQVFSIEDALAVDEHPNGTLDWAPISDGKSVDLHAAYAEAFKAITAIAERPPTPVALTVNASPVNVTTPEVKAPEITVNVPEQPAPVVTVTAEQPVVNVTNIPPAVEVKAPDIRVDAPVVNVTTPDVQITNIPPAIEVKAPDVHVDAPVVTVTTPDVHVDAPVTVTLPEPKPTTKTVHRDRKGQITGITEEPG